MALVLIWNSGKNFVKIRVFTLLVRMSGFSVYNIHVKTAETIWPKFCVGPHITLGKVMDAQNCKKLFKN